MAGGARKESHDRIDAAILEAARTQLAEVGAAGLSLRLLAREVGMVSSAIYRYVESRDALLTRLIIAAYNDLGDVTEAALRTSKSTSHLDRWVATARAVRRWALANRHEYLLLFGTPVPGYTAPVDTIDPGTRVLFALASIVRDAAVAHRLAPTIKVATTKALNADMTRLVQLAGIDTGIDTAIDAGIDVAVAFVTAWTQLFGIVSFELTNQTRGMTTSNSALFDATVHQSATLVGLR